MSSVINQLGSGALSGLTTTLCLQPYLLKTRMQQADRQIRPKYGTSLLFYTVHDIVAKNGLRGLWRGTGATLMRNTIGVAFYMTALTQLRTRMASSPSFAALYKQPRTSTANSSALPTLTSTGNLISGATTRLSVGFVLNPLSIIKVRYESNLYPYKSLIGALVSTVRQGPRELLRGYMATSLRDAPYAGIFVLFYEGIKHETSYLVLPTSQYHSTVIHGLSAVSASSIATMVTQPFDVIKTKTQVRQEDRYRGFLRTMSTIWQQRGLRGYFDGASLRMSRKGLSSALGWMVYEAILMFVRTSKQHS